MVFTTVMTSSMRVTSCRMNMFNGTRYCGRRKKKKAPVRNSEKQFTQSRCTTEQPRINPGTIQEPRINPSTKYIRAYPTTPLAGRVVRGRCLPRNSRAAAAAIHWLFPPQCPRVSGLAVLCPLCFWLFSFWPGMFFLFLWGNFLSIHFLPPRCWWWWLLPPR